MYTELFKLCGFESEEIERERPRIDRTFEIAGIGAEDVKQAEARVTKYFDTSLSSVRKILGIWLKQLMDLTLSKEEGKTVVYTSFPSAGVIGLSANLASEKVYCQAPEIVLDLAMGQIFGKLDPILEAAEEHGLPPGLGMCSLNQARVGAIIKGIAPVPDFTLTSGFFCDQTAKVDDFLHEVYGVPCVFIDSCLDSNWDEFPEISPRRVQYLASEMRRGFDEFQQVLGIEITEEARHEARRGTAKLWFAMAQVWELMRSDPVPISQVDLGLFFWMIASIEHRAVAEGPEAISTLIREVKQRVDEGKGVIEKGSPRVLLAIHQATDPSVVHMIEELGLAIPITGLASISSTEVAKSTYATTEERRADTELRRGLYHSASALVYRYKELCNSWNVDGVVNLYPFSCRPAAYPALILKKSIEEELGIPVLALEGDIWDTRDYSAGALRTRVETFGEMLRARKAVTAS